MADYTSKYKGDQIDEAVGKALSGGAGAVTSVNGQTGNVQLDIPEVPDWAMQTEKPTYTASEVGALPSTYTPPNQTAEQVGADPAGTAVDAVDGHNEDESAHGDIRELITTLTQRLNAIADSDDVSLDQLSEIVAYIKSNKSIIDSIAIDKVSVTDVINNLTSTATNKPLSAAQGKALKALFDAIVVPTKTSQLTNDSGYLTAHQDISGLLPRTELDTAIDTALAAAKESGEFDGSDGVGVANIYQKTTSVVDGGENVYVVELTDGTVSNFKVRNGSKGSAGNGITSSVLNADYTLTLTFDDGTSYTTSSIRGEKGDLGDTPIKGTDYYTDEDKAEFSEYIASELAKRGQLKPEFAQSEEWLNANGDTSKLYVLPDGLIYGYIQTITEGETVPNYTNLLDDPNAYIKNGYRYSHSSAAFKAQASDCAIVVPIPTVSECVIRVRGATMNGCNYPGSIYFDTNNTTFGVVVPDSNQVTHGDDENGDAKISILKMPSTAYSYVVFHVAHVTNVDALIVTVNEEIVDVTTPGGVEYRWASTGHAFVPADYEDRIVDLEAGLADAKTDIETLQEKVSGVSISTNATTAFSVPAYCPVPQLPADGSEGTDFDYKSVTTQDAYDYMDALCSKYTQYITKQTMGKDASDTFDHNRYILSKAYWRAWQKENYPRMFAWINGSTVIYSVSVSPRVGDTMYTTPYIGTVYNTVTAVNSAAKTASTRTVNGLVFTRYESGDAEPTIAYTKPYRYPGDFATATVYNSSYGSLTTVSTVGNDYIIGADGIKYTRYPFEDRRQDKTKPLSVFILSNEHGLNGDALIPSFAVMRMAKDLCKNTDNPFLKWLKENCMITMIPVGNPWGYARYLATDGNTSGYYNVNGVNINRNYDTPGWSTSDTNYGDTETFGTYPGCEVETQHIMNTMRLCKPAVGISMHGLGLPTEYADMPDNGYFIYQGQGFDSARVHKVTEALFSAYSLGPGTSIDYAQHYEMCGKSPAYIQYVGAVGGLTETICWEAGTPNTYTAMAMEQAYTQLLLFLQNWCEEALEKLS